MGKLGRRLVAGPLLVLAIPRAATTAAAQSAPRDTAAERRLGPVGAAVERDTTPLLSAARLAALPAAERATWRRYIAASDSIRRADREAMRRELATAGRAQMLAAPHDNGFFVQPWMTTTWLRSDSGRQLAASILTWQTPSGGWSKRLDVWTPRQSGMAFGTEGDGWAYVPTIDNSATIEQLRFLGLAIDAGSAPSGAARAVRRGLDYLLRAQYPNGCVPQVFPLQGGYHDAATFNDDATVNVLRVFRAAADGA